MLRKPRSVRHLLQDKPDLKRLDREIRAQATLLTHVRQCLPADLASHCLHAQLHDERLVIHVSTASWATRLRYVAPQLVSALSGEYPNLCQVGVRLLLDAPRRHAGGQMANHSDRAAEIIHSSAGHTKSTSLQAALSRLGEAVKLRSG